MHVVQLEETCGLVSASSLELRQRAWLCERSNIVSKKKTNLTLPKIYLT
jgi:hypothetical protein